MRLEVLPEAAVIYRSSHSGHTSPDSSLEDGTFTHCPDRRNIDRAFFFPNIAAISIVLGGFFLSSSVNLVCYTDK